MKILGIEQRWPPFGASYADHPGDDLDNLTEMMIETVRSMLIEDCLYEDVYYGGE